MSIEKIRSSLNSDDLAEFDKTLSNFSMVSDVNHEIVDFDDPYNFVLKSRFNSKPYTGIVFFRDGKVASTICN